MKGMNGRKGGSKRGETEGDGRRHRGDRWAVAESTTTAGGQGGED